MNGHEPACRHRPKLKHQMKRHPVCKYCGKHIRSDSRIENLFLFCLMLVFLATGYSVDINAIPYMIFLAALILALWLSIFLARCLSPYHEVDEDGNPVGRSADHTSADPAACRHKPPLALDWFYYDQVYRCRKCGTRIQLKHTWPQMILVCFMGGVSGIVFNNNSFFSGLIFTAALFFFLSVMLPLFYAYVFPFKEVPPAPPPGEGPKPPPRSFPEALRRGRNGLQ